MTTNLNEQAVRTPKTKTRYLSPYEYFEIVQIEYICAKLRARLFTKTYDKTFWNKVAEGKRVTINSIAEKNKLPSIFTDSDLEAALNRRVYRETTFPIFCYKDEKSKLNQEYFDLLYYYSSDADIRFDYEGEVLVGKVKKYQPFDLVMVVEVDSKEYKISVNNAVRIL